jgi:hypothetical protein
MAKCCENCNEYISLSRILLIVRVCYYYYYYYIYCTASKLFALHFDQSSEILHCEGKRTLITSRNRGLIQARGWGNRNSLGSLHRLLLLEEKTIVCVLV